MKYWPMSVIADSPRMPPRHAIEAREVCHTYSMTAAAAASCSDAASFIAPQDAPNLAIIESAGAPARQVFLRHPGREEWGMLERANLVTGGDGQMYLIVDSTH